MYSQPPQRTPTFSLHRRMMLQASCIGAMKINMVVTQMGDWCPPPPCFRPPAAVGCAGGVTELRLGVMFLFSWILFSELRC